MCGILKLCCRPDGDDGAGVGVSAVSKGDQRPGLIAAGAEVLDDRQVNQASGVGTVAVAG